MKKYMFLALLFLPGCYNREAETNNALKNFGLTPVSIDGPGFLGCGRDDAYVTKFTASRPDGTIVHGVSCAGLMFKGTTIRFF